MRTKALSEYSATHDTQSPASTDRDQNPRRIRIPGQLYPEAAYDVPAHVTRATNNYDIHRALHSSRIGYADAPSSGAPVLLFQSSREAPIDNHSTLALPLLRYSKQAHPAANQTGHALVPRSEDSSGCQGGFSACVSPFSLRCRAQTRRTHR